MDILNLLGTAWYYLPVIFDMANESKGIREFNILKNIAIEGEPVVEINKPYYQYNILEAWDPISLEGAPLFFGLTGPRGKQQVFDHFYRHYGIDPLQFINLIHPRSYTAPSVELEFGIMLEPGVIIASQTRIGYGVTIKRGTTVGHHVILEEYTEINPGVTISGNVHIGRACILGSGCVIRDQVRVGEKCIIGMGSVVTHDIPPGVIAYGNPCKVIKKNDKWDI